MDSDLDLDEPVAIANPRPEWTLQAGQVAGQLQPSLNPYPLEHIGSTAVPGLSAKPIIDLMAGVPITEHSRTAHVLVAHGFVDLGEAGVPGRRYLRRRKRPLVNLHLITYEGIMWKDNLLLRDYLRSNPDEADRYAHVKYQAAREHPTLLAYSEAKSEYVRQLLARARSTECRPAAGTGGQ